MKQKKLIFNFFVNRNWKKLTDSRKKAKILADNRKSHHPIETLSYMYSTRTSPMQANGEAASRDKRDCSQVTWFFFKAYQRLVLVSLEKGRMGVRNRGKIQLLYF